MGRGPVGRGPGAGRPAGRVARATRRAGGGRRRRSRSANNTRNVRHDRTGTSDRDSATTPSYRPLPSEAVRHPCKPHEHGQHDREQQYHHVHGAHLIPLVLTCKKGPRALIRRRRPLEPSEQCPLLARRNTYRAVTIGTARVGNAKHRMYFETG